MSKPSNEREQIYKSSSDSPIVQMLQSFRAHVVLSSICQTKNIKTFKNDYPEIISTLKQIATQNTNNTKEFDFDEKTILATIDELTQSAKPKTTNVVNDTTGENAIYFEWDYFPEDLNSECMQENMQEIAKAFNAYVFATIKYDKYLTNLSEEIPIEKHKAFNEFCTTNKISTEEVEELQITLESKLREKAERALENKLKENQSVNSTPEKKRSNSTPCKLTKKPRILENCARLLTSNFGATAEEGMHHLEGDCAIFETQGMDFRPHERNRTDHFKCFANMCWWTLRKKPQVAILNALPFMLGALGTPTYAIVGVPFLANIGLKLASEYDKLPLSTFFSQHKVLTWSGYAVSATVIAAGSSCLKDWIGLDFEKIKYNVYAMSLLIVNGEGKDTHSFSLLNDMFLHFKEICEKNGIDTENVLDNQHFAKLENARNELTKTLGWTAQRNVYSETFQKYARNGKGMNKAAENSMLFMMQCMLTYSVSFNFQWAKFAIQSYLMLNCYLTTGTWCYQPALARRYLRDNDIKNKDMQTKKKHDTVSMILETINELSERRVWNETNNMNKYKTTMQDTLTLLEINKTKYDNGKDDATKQRMPSQANSVVQSELETYRNKHAVEFAIALQEYDTNLQNEIQESIKSTFGFPDASDIFDDSVLDYFKAYKSAKKNKYLQIIPNCIRMLQAQKLRIGNWDDPGENRGIDHNLMALNRLLETTFKRAKGYYYFETRFNALGPIFHFEEFCTTHVPAILKVLWLVKEAFPHDVTEKNAVEKKLQHHEALRDLVSIKILNGDQKGQDDNNPDDPVQFNDQGILTNKKIFIRLCNEQLKPNLDPNLRIDRMSLLETGRDHQKKFWEKEKVIPRVVQQEAQQQQAQCDFEQTVRGIDHELQFNDNGANNREVLDDYITNLETSGTRATAEDAHTYFHCADAAAPELKFGAQKQLLKFGTSVSDQAFQNFEVNGNAIVNGRHKMHSQVVEEVFRRMECVEQLRRL